MPWTSEHIKWLVDTGERLKTTDGKEVAVWEFRHEKDEAVLSAWAKHFRNHYCLDTDPFDCGMTIATGLRGRPNHDSQANGAMMRISPLGIFGANHPLETVGDWARQDAALTHPNPVCQQAHAIFAMAIAHSIKTGAEPQSLYQDIADWAADLEVEPALMDAILGTAEAPPADYVQQQGWVLIAFHNKGNGVEPALPGPGERPFRAAGQKPLTTGAFRRRPYRSRGSNFFPL